MIKNCARCNAIIDCRSDHIENCACFGIPLHDATRRYLEKTRYGCLCNRCLLELNEMAVRAKDHKFPLEFNEMQERLHFYREGGMIVFTEFYHILKGYCCENGCRHCAYGFKKQEQP